MKLSDGFNNPVYTFTITVNSNSAPTLSAPLTDLSLVVGSSLTYTLPSISDIENDPLTISTVQNSLTILPNFVSFSSSTFSINPNN